MQSAGVTFDDEEKCFVVGGVKKRGVTKILAGLLPVPRTRRTAKEDDESSDEKPPVSVEVFYGSVLRKCSNCKRALAWARALDPKVYRVAANLELQPDDTVAHGTVVDYQLRLWVRLGRKKLFSQCPHVDPCVGTLIEQFDANGWSPVAAQLPIYDLRTDIATAIDILATDRATRTKLFLIEIKASMSAAQALVDDAEYTRVRGILKRSVLKNLPQSYHGRHQMQLLFMNDTVERNFAFRFDRSLVMRAAPGSVASYELSPTFIERREDIASALERKRAAKSAGGGAKKRRRKSE